MHTRHQLARAERLGHVVVGADREPDEHVGLAVARGEHQDRHGAFPLDLLAHLDAVETGEHEVEHDEVGAHPVAERDAARAVARDLHLVALAAQAGGDGGRDRRFVLDHGDPAPGGGHGHDIDRWIGPGGLRRTAHSQRIKTAGGGVATRLWRNGADGKLGDQAESRTSRADIVAAVTSGAPDLVALARVIGRFVGETVEVGGLRRCSGGASRETWALDATDAHGRVHELILRRDPAEPGRAPRTARPSTP